MVKQKNINWQQISAVVVACLAVLIFGYWYWNSQVNMNPEKVFWDTIDRNLQTASVTKEVKQEQKNVGSFYQSTVLQLKSSLMAKTTVVIESKINFNSKVTTTTIGTTTRDYLMYKSIQPKEKAPKNLVGVWGVSEKGSQPQILAEALFSSPIIFGYLNSEKRESLVNQMKTDKVFKTDFLTTNTQFKQDKNKYYAYDLIINIAPYTKTFSNYLKMIGQDELAKQIDNSSDSGEYKLKMIIDPVKRQPVKIIPASSTSLPEEFKYFDVIQNISEPQNVKLSIAELQSKFNN